jgi:hypothetical protein
MDTTKVIEYTWEDIEMILVALTMLENPEADPESFAVQNVYGDYSTAVHPDALNGCSPLESILVSFKE